MTRQLHRGTSPRSRFVGGDPGGSGRALAMVALVVVLATLAGCGACAPEAPPLEEGSGGGGTPEGSGGGGVGGGGEGSTATSPDGGTEAGTATSGDADGAVSTAGVEACGPVLPWDRDGDGISDAVEENHRTEGYFPLDPDRCNTDPSLPRGTYYDGALDGSLNLKDRGVGYVHNRGSDPVDGDDWGALPLVRCLEAVGRRWEDSGLVVGINDLSQRPGRRFPPHRSHQNGLDADLRYIRTDGANAPLDIRRNPELYDLVATQALLRLFVELCDVQVLFVDLEHLGFGDAELGADREVLVQAPGHSNHFHVRLTPPA